MSQVDRKVLSAEISIGIISLLPAMDQQGLRGEGRVEGWGLNNNNNNNKNKGSEAAELGRTALAVAMKRPKTPAKAKPPLHPPPRWWTYYAEF